MTTNKRKLYPCEFKLEAASLVLDKGYTQKEAQEAMGVSKSAISQWVKQLKTERSGVTPIGSRALTADQQEIQALKAQVAKLEREKSILKKASALLMMDSYQSYN